MLINRKPLRRTAPNALGENDPSDCLNSIGGPLCWRYQEPQVRQAYENVLWSDGGWSLLSHGAAKAARARTHTHTHTHFAQPKSWSNGWIQHVDLSSRITLAYQEFSRQGGGGGGGVYSDSYMRVAIPNEVGPTRRASLKPVG